MANNQITPFRLIDQFTMGNFNQRINETNTALQNKAPAGFGLGGAGKELTSADNLDNIWQCGFYYWGSSVPQNATNAYGVMLVLSRGSNVFVQEVTYCTPVTASYPLSSVKMRRIIYGGTPYPWEYDNPPLELNTEYPTTERYLGKTVYAKALSVGDIAANNLSIVNTFSNSAEAVVRCYAMAKYNGSMVTTPQNGQYGGIHFTADGFVYATNNNVRVYVMSDTSMTDCVAVAYYTKA